MTTMKAVPATCTTSHRAALAQVRAELKQRFFERDDVVDGLLTAILAQLHVVLLGPPGTAKSALVNALVERIDGAESFQWLLTKFTTPEELFGPISLKALQQDRFQRITTGKLPEAEVAFVDETFKASSAILNALLTLMNERVFHDDGQARSCPLMTLVGASNELPEGEELDALFDRFLLRFWVPYLAEQRNVRRLLSSSAAPVQTRITLDELAACQREVAQVVLPDALFDSLLTLKERTEEQGFRASDRRWRQVVDVLKARAYLDGDDEVTEDHLDVLADVLWQQPKDRPALATLVGTVGNPLNVRANEVLDAAREALSGLGTVDGHDATARADWLKAASLAESRLSAMERELDELVNDNPKRRLDRVREVRRAIGDMRQDVTRRVAAVYGIA
ncbi:MAG: AAA family ATPase [Polyangiaceae bacterium]|nr:AAA family ATPase [Polyangiaceae bacterium]